MAYAYKMVEDNATFGIYEIATEQVIKTFTDRSEARKFLRHVNLGGGFNGWTPTFFMRPIEINLSTG